MIPATKRKAPVDAANSKSAPSIKPVKKQRTPASKKTGPYKFTFGPQKGATIEEVYSTTRGHLLEYEEDTERGTMKILDNITWRRFWEATDRAALLKGHENAPKAKLDDLVDVLTEPEVYDGESQIHIAFTATIIWIERDELFEQLYWIRILPCGWRWEAGMNKDLRLVLDGKQTASDDDLKNMVYRTYRFSGNCGAVPSPNNWPRWLDKMQDPEPTGPSKGCCFKVVGSVTKVDGEQVEVHVAQEPTRMMETQELERLARQITVHLVKGVDQPEMGSSYVFKGLFEPFAKEMQDTNFMAEV